MKRQPSRRGFTLIELIMAIGLGTILIYTAIAAFRTASQAVTVANALSIENAMMRAGYVEAHEQLDFWTAVDDPDDPSRQRLRTPVDGHHEGNDQRGWLWTWNWQIIDPSNTYPDPPTLGLPFSKMPAVFPYRSGSIPRATPSAATGSATVPGVVNDIVPRAAPVGDDPWESDLGWDPSYAWAAHDPRTWFQGNMAEKLRPGAKRWETDYPRLWFGRYGIFTNTTRSPALNSFSVKYDPADPSETAHQTTYPTSDVPHRWYGNQLSGLARALGFYGFCEYVPSNSIDAWYTDANWWTTDGGMHQRCLAPWWDFCNGDGFQVTPRGIYRLTYATSYIISDPSDSVAQIDLLHDHYKHYDTDYDAKSEAGSETSYEEFLRKSMWRYDVAPLLPATWPRVTVSVGRFIKNGRFLQMARIRRMNPRTGETTELSFAGNGTTLRGARMQRRPDAGWAKWDNANLTANDPTLDTP